MRWAVFKDFRGVAYCEPVDEGLNVWILDLPARQEKRNWWGKVVAPAREATRLQKVVFDETIYSRANYCASAFAPAPDGYKFRNDIRYLIENRWGPVEVLVFLYSDDIGRRMQYEFRKLAPERELYDLGRNRDNSAKPHPDTDRIIEQLSKEQT